MDKTILSMVANSKIPSNEENNRLAVLAQKGDLDATEKLVAGNSRLIIQLVYKYKRKYTLLDEDDLFQSGICGLLLAIKYYDADKGSFSTTVHYWAKAMILQVCKQQDGIHYDASFYQKKNRYECLKNAIGDENVIPNEQELADYNLTLKDAETIRKYQWKETSYEEIIESSSNVSLEVNLEYREPDEKLLEEELKSTLNSEMNRFLTKTEIMILSRYYGLNDFDPENMAKIADHLKKSGYSGTKTRQGVRRCIKSAERKLSRSRSIRELYKS